MSAEDIVSKIDNWVADVIFNFAFCDNSKSLQTAEIILESMKMGDLIQVWHKHRGTKKSLANRFFQELNINLFADKLSQKIAAINKSPSTSSLLPIKIWGLCVLFLQDVIFKDHFHNVMLKMMEKPISSSVESVRIQALEAWKMLVMNFSGVQNFFESQGRPKLLMMPILACLSDEKLLSKINVRRTCFEVWQLLVDTARDENSVPKVFTIVIGPVLQHVSQERDQELKNDLLQYLSNVLFHSGEENIEKSLQLLRDNFDILVNRFLVMLNQNNCSTYAKALFKVVYRDESLISKLYCSVAEIADKHLRDMLLLLMVQIVPAATLFSLRDNEGQSVLIRTVISASEMFYDIWSEVVKQFRKDSDRGIIVFSRPFMIDLVGSLLNDATTKIWSALVTEMDHDLTELGSKSSGDLRSLIEKHESRAKDGILSCKIAEPQFSKVLIDILMFPLRADRADAKDDVLSSWINLFKSYCSYLRLINSPPFNYPSKQQRQDIASNSAWIDKISTEIIDTIQLQKAIIISNLEARSKESREEWTKVYVSIANAVVWTCTHDSLNIVIRLIDSVVDICFDNSSVLESCSEVIIEWAKSNCNNLKQSKSFVERIIESRISTEAWKVCH